MADMRVLMTCLLLLCACPPVLDDVDGGDEPAVSLKHAHNDYEHPRPLHDALEHGFQSVEADVWLDGTGVGVSHDGAPFKGSLDALYLTPLEELVTANGGSVHGDGQPFFLWLDLKDGSEQHQATLAQRLAARSFLTTFNDDGVESEGAVTVLLTGHDTAKKALADRTAPRPYARDSNSYKPDDAAADGKWRAYAVPYFGFFTWNGQGDMPESEVRQLRNLVNGAHRNGRIIRIYASPETPAYWRAAKEAGLDFIGTDDLAGLDEVVSE